MLIYTYTCSYRIHTDAMNKDEGRLLKKNMYLSVYCKGSKRVTQGFTVRGSWGPNRDCNILTPLLWPSAWCLSRSPDAQPEGWGPTLLAFSSTSYHQLVWSPNSIGGPEGPFGRVWLSLPHLVSITSDLQLSDFLS